MDDKKSTTRLSSPSDKIIHCRRCKKITAHELLDAFKVRCLRCGNIKDLKNPYLEAEIATRGDPRKD